ncbi:MAG: hypothetical protein RH982_05920 [Parvibaculum sp.]
MMKPAMTLLLGLLTVSPLAAEERLAGADDLRHAQISEADCARLAPYLPGGADYVPGVAADGSAVAPADLDGGYGYGHRPVYEFDATLDPLIGRNPAFNSATKLTVARIAIDMKTGRTTIDGHDVAGGNHALAEACAGLHHKPVK